MFSGWILSRAFHKCRRCRCPRAGPSAAGPPPWARRKRVQPPTPPLDSCREVQRQQLRVLMDNRDRILVTHASSAFKGEGMVNSLGVHLCRGRGGCDAHGGFGASLPPCLTGLLRYCSGCTHRELRGGSPTSCRSGLSSRALLH